MQNKANTFFYFYQIPCMSKWANNGTNQGLYLGAGFCLWFYYFCYLQNPNVHHYLFANGNQPTISLTQKLVQQLFIKVINETSKNKEYNLQKFLLISSMCDRSRSITTLQLELNRGPLFCHFRICSRYPTITFPNWVKWPLTK